MLTAVDEGRHGWSLLLRGPLGHQDVHGREGGTTAQAHQDAHQDEVLEAVDRTDRAQERCSDVENDGDEEDPLAAVQLSNATSGNLGDEVAPEVGAQDETLVWFRPK